jgi:hypothetical protein
MQTSYVRHDHREWHRYRSRLCARQHGRDHRVPVGRVRDRMVHRSAARAPLRTARRRVTYRAALTSGPESPATGTSSGAREAAMAAFELATASDADVDDGASSWPTVRTLRQRSSTCRCSRKAAWRLTGTSTAGSSTRPRLWRAAPALARAACQRLRTIEQVAAKATKRSASA